PRAKAGRTSREHRAHSDYRCTFVRVLCGPRLPAALRLQWGAFFPFCRSVLYRDTYPRPLTSEKRRVVPTGQSTLLTKMFGWELVRVKFVPCIRRGVVPSLCWVLL